MHAQELGKSDHIKAAYLFNLLKFTTWPESESHTSLTLCLLGKKTGSMEVAQQELQNRNTQSRTLKVIHILAPSVQNASTELANCHLLYLNLPQTEMQEVQQFAHAHHMLTLSELKHSARRGTMVEFEVDERKNRVVIIINERTAKTAGIFFSAKLLQLADVIRD